MADTGDKSGGNGGWRLGLAATLLGILIGAGAMLVFNGYFVRSYLLANPEVIPEAMTRLQQSRTAEAVNRHRASLERPYHSAWAGAADGDVVLVEFFDYACGYCRASNADVERLLREDPRLKVVWRELPVLGPNSETAAYASMAAARAGRFRQFHDHLFGLGRLTEATLAEASRALGVATDAGDVHRAELARNSEIVTDLITARGGQLGTPTFVVGNQVIDGAVGYDALKRAIAEARAARS